MEIRKMKKSEYPVIRKLWQECFGDEEAYIDFFFRTYGDGSETWILEENREDDGLAAGSGTDSNADSDAGGKAEQKWPEKSIVGMVSEMKATLYRTQKREDKAEELVPFRVTYQYAGGVWESRRGRGLFRKLMSARREAAVFADGSVMFEPAPHLFTYYHKMGYQDVFWIKESCFAAETECAAELKKAGPDEYKKVRDRFFAGDGYVCWDTAHVRYALAECERSGGGAYYTDEARSHIALTAGVQEDVLLVKEAMIPEENLKAELGTLAASFGCKKISVRLPAWSRFSGKIRPFGVGYGAHFAQISRPYLNLTLD